MKIVIAQHKGGVGKTTLAVHVASILAIKKFSKTLVIDCDSQGDSFRFFTFSFPETPLKIVQGMDNVDVMWNPQRDKFSTKSSFSEYNNIVIDVDTRVTNSLQIILEANPNVILIPVDNQELSLTHGLQALEMINSLIGRFAYPTKVLFVQMGSNWTLEHPSYKIPYSIEFDQCLNKFDYIWNVQNELEFMINEFKGLLNYVKSQ